MYENENRIPAEMCDDATPCRRPKDERSLSVAEVLQNTVNSLQISIEIMNKIMLALTGVMPEQVHSVKPDNMIQHVSTVENLIYELRRRLEDTVRAICG